MQCEQIRPLLSDYRSGILPSYKVAWVAQHLAACGECQGELRSGGRSAVPEVPAAEPVPVAASLDPAVLGRGESSEAIQRPVPGWVQLTLILVLVSLAGVSAWLIVARQHTQPQRQRLTGTFRQIPSGYGELSAEKSNVVNIWSLGVRELL